MQLKESEMQHHFRERERELERKWQITREMSGIGPKWWAKHQLDKKPASMSALNEMKMGIIHDF